ncbi:D-2-hydroxyglutarate dehydrogenase, mitochondrial-like isoform X2 [Homarus americanus]|uniref:D-2-hydroxyglutarate dehydrogenase, mitochondrial n=1 Tax=Homarus americanus TaxID=6706 RepID=A0A8J5K1V0_HOMAM|nr:D-2-hydroxyglutarate dehydrogenase, mitochondrial-like isoform X2 [Homarus americanus]KAG7163479.1 D-2-hydroxyglutarate dehydrogenase-like [Homarus americanus]
MMIAARCTRLGIPIVKNLTRVSSTSMFKSTDLNQHYIHSSVTCFPKCELTSKRYQIERGQFSTISEEDVNFFTNLLGHHRVINDETELEGYNIDWLGMVRGASSVLLKPKTTEEVSTILAYCNKRKLAVCPQGGNTGLVGGSVPVFDEIIISTALMNKVENVDTWLGVVTCQSGCVLEALDEHVSEYGLMIPLDLGAKGSCHIGGNVSTNAGGLRLLRYGSLHGSVLGVEAVLASGEIVDCLSAMKKDNTGYDLKQLFIGSEGTLGLVTKIAINCPPRPQSVNLAFLGLETFDDVLKTYKDAKKKLGEILSSCEFIDQSSIECVEKNLKLKAPIGAHPFYMLIETSGSNGIHDEEKLNVFLEEALGAGLVTDGTVATEPSRMHHIWSIRERIAEALINDGCTYKYDISLPLPHFYKMVEDMREHLGSNILRCCGYGHIGDGNLHLNITSKEFEKDLLNLIEPTIFEWTAKVNGSISAEHGVGFKKRNYIHYSKSSGAIALMKQLKALMDPNGILNPYKVLPDN